ncbi:MAG: hypothetical protein PHS66_03865 [Candidatus Omnitrophica bacterium]|nr:hypothetical protein [Candidatus Omnitrophota bacterium]
MEDWLFFDWMRVIIFWTSPAVFLVGVALLIYSNYTKIEAIAGKEYGLRKRILPKLEQNIYIFHEWCLRKHVLIGLVCIIYALVVFLLLRRFTSLGEVIGEV